MPRAGHATRPEPRRDELTTWFSDRLGPTWFTSFALEWDADEIMVVGTLADPGDCPDDRACLHAVKEFRTTSRAERSQISQEAEETFGRKVSWGLA